MEKLLVLEQGEKYSDKKEQYFMVPNWLFDDGEYLDLDVYYKCQPLNVSFRSFKSVVF